jgi:DNA-binding transcriptional MerR regulator
MLVPIGVFSQMTRLSVRMLRRYDESRLLVPAEVDPVTGYRYYSPNQAARAEAIRALRAIDVPLDEIAAILAADDTRARQLLATHRDRLVTETERRLEMLAAAERLVDGKDPILPYEVRIESVPDTLVLTRCEQVTIDTVGARLAAGFAAVLVAARTAGVEPTAPPFVEFIDVIDDETDGTIAMCLPIPAPVENPDAARFAPWRGLGCDHPAPRTVRDDRAGVSRAVGLDP